MKEGKNDAKFSEEAKMIREFKNQESVTNYI